MDLADRNALIATLDGEGERRRAIAALLKVTPTTVDGIIARHRRREFRYEYTARRSAPRPAGNRSKA